MKYIEASSFTIAGLRSLVAFFTLLICTRKLPTIFVRQEVENTSDSEKSKKAPVDKKQTL